MKRVVCISALFILLSQQGLSGFGFLKHPPAMHIVSIGINRYSGLNVSPLRCCEADATEFADSLARVATRICDNVYRCVLLSERATRQAIQDSMEAVTRRSRPDDVMVFFFSGHSTIDKQSNMYLLPTDVSVDKKTNVYGNAISGELLKTWLARVAARNQMIILDAGRSSFDAFKSMYEEERMSQNERLQPNIVMLSIYPLGYDGPNHGLLTDCLLRGLAGQAATNPQTRQISAWGLETFANRKVFECGDSSFGGKLRISSYVQGKDFALGYAIIGIAGLQELRSSRAAEPVLRDITQPLVPVRSPKNYALLFASDRYDSYRTLVNPTYDANTLAAELKDNYGFVTETVLNPPRDTIEAKIMHYFDMKFADGDQLLVFFAGHGDYREEGKQGFVIARDSRPKSDDRLCKSYIKHTDLRDWIDQINCKHILVILDVCFGGTFDQRIAESVHRSGDEYQEVADSTFLARKSKIQTRWYLTSGGKEYVPDGRPGHHSPFAFKLIETLREHVDKKRILTTSGLKSALEKMTPEPCMGEFGSYEPKGDFVFVPK
jgi:uncharacterized caspase-like protein